jgi:DNA-binding transcriptional ArsR family regulator
MVQFVHPATKDLTLTGVLGALADPARLRIFKSMVEHKACMSCSEASPYEGMAKSTLSHHFRILREAGLIQTSKQGVEHRNVVRADDINARFPGLLKTILKLAENIDDRKSSVV